VTRSPAERGAAGERTDASGGAAEDRPAVRRPVDERGSSRPGDAEPEEASFSALDEQLRERTATRLAGLGSGDRPSRQGPNRRRPNSNR